MDSQGAHIVKYGFGTVFENGDSERRFRRDPKSHGIAPEPPAFFTAEDLKAARDHGFNDGVAAGREQELGTIGQQLAEAQTAIGKALADAIRAYHERRALALRDTATLARTMARKIVGKLIETMPASMIEDSLAQCLDRLHQTPAITVRVPEALVESIAPAITAAATEAGFTGAITVAGESALADASVRIEWADGGATRITATLWTEIDTLIDRFLGDEADIAPDRAERT